LITCFTMNCWTFKPVRSFNSKQASILLTAFYCRGKPFQGLHPNKNPRWLIPAGIFVHQLFKQSVYIVVQKPVIAQNLVIVVQIET
jgi:hypothetical protein